LYFEVFKDFSTSCLLPIPDLGATGYKPIPSNRDIDEVAFPGDRRMMAEQRKLPGEFKYPVVS
jgi:hypothetical protein